MESKESRCFTYLVARLHGYVGSWYFQTRSGVNYVANLASGFHAFFFTGKDWCSRDSCLDEHLFKVGRLSTCAESFAADLVFGGWYVAVAFPSFHNSFVSGDNGRMVCLYERQAVH